MKKEISKPLLFLQKFKELTDVMDSMSSEDIEVLQCALEYLALHNKYPKYVQL